MIGVLTGFAVVGLAIVTGYVVARIDLLGEHARYVLSRLTFFVLNPFLLFSVLADADLNLLFSALLPVSVLAAASMFLVYGLIARLVWKRSAGATVLGALGAGYVNANNIGIPISTYLLGNGAYSAPVILVQLLVITPVVLAVLDAVSSGGAAGWRELGRALRRTLRNPMIIGAALGVLVAVLDIDLPPLVSEPIDLLAGAAVPVLLLSFGMSLYGQRVLTTRASRPDVLLATGLKLLAMPVAAWAIGLLFQLDAHAMLVVVVLASLPSAQNVFNYAQRYGVGEVLARDVVFLTTFGCVPVVFGAALLFGA
ncbi:AEC family transporter [Microbacterium marinilacus]|uniref:AEC family transporter n=1 Tax=Microbacterium marinilacus TaxID=415209 RepID=A0ABP7B268_9MICO|nr:AEC family transporter [Microbacterium marinilacus]MBY0688679.1 AEC family transporter [Microbacterium marinilacus]